MIILLPLALIGAGYLVVLLFGAASYALPLIAAFSAGVAAAHAGASGTAALLLGIAIFMAVIAAGRMATLLPSRHAHTAVTLLFAVPAAIAGFQVAVALLRLGGVGGGSAAVASIMALTIGAVAAKRYATPLRD